MPWVAKTTDGDRIAPEEADPDAQYECPVCDDILTTRCPWNRADSMVAKHFWHSKKADTECTGESDRHKRMKSIAMSKAKQRWPDAAVTWESSVGNRRADVLVDFDGLRSGLGRGVSIEVQHKNTTKDVEAVTADYRDNGFSVLWLYGDAYSESDVQLQQGDLRFYDYSDLYFYTQCPRCGTQRHHSRHAKSSSVLCSCGSYYKVDPMTGQISVVKQTPSVSE